LRSKKELAMNHATNPKPNRGRWAPLVITAAALLAACGGGSEPDATHSIAQSAADADSAACDNRVNNTHAKLQQCVTLAGVRSH
jgi:hypothetical protein